MWWRFEDWSVARPLQHCGQLHNAAPWTGEKQNRPLECVCSGTKAFIAKSVMSSSSSGTHTRLSCTCLTLSAGCHPENKLPALLFMLLKAERFSLISEGGRGKKGEALWMEREFHLDSTGLNFFFKVFQSQRGRLIKTGLPLAVVLKASRWTSCSSKGRGGRGGGRGASLNTSSERHLYQSNPFLWFAVIFLTNTKKKKKKKKKFAGSHQGGECSNFFGTNSAAVHQLTVPGSRGKLNVGHFSSSSTWAINTPKQKKRGLMRRQRGELMRIKLDESSVVFSSEDSSFFFHAPTDPSLLFRGLRRAARTLPSALPCRRCMLELP